MSVYVRVDWLDSTRINAGWAPASDYSGRSAPDWQYWCDAISIPRAAVTQDEETEAMSRRHKQRAMNRPVTRRYIERQLTALRADIFSRLDHEPEWHSTQTVEFREYTGEHPLVARADGNGVRHRAPDGRYMKERA